MQAIIQFKNEQEKKVTMVEHLDNYNNWAWYSVTTLSPKQAVIAYAKEQCWDFTNKDVEDANDTFYLLQEVRAYEITISEDEL